MVFSTIVKLSEVAQPEISIPPGWWQVIVSILLPSIPSIVIVAFISGKLWAKVTAILKKHDEKIQELCCQLDPEDKASVLVTKGECLATKTELVAMIGEVKVLITGVQTALHSRLNRIDKSREDAWAAHNKIMTDLVNEVGKVTGQVNVLVNRGK